MNPTLIALLVLLALGLASVPKPKDQPATPPAQTMGGDGGTGDPPEEER